MLVDARRLRDAGQDAVLQLFVVLAHTDRLEYTDNRHLEHYLAVPCN